MTLLRPRLPLTLFLLSSALGARADCFIDNNGFERCRISTGARIAIAVCLVVGLILLLGALGMYRQRRQRQANLAYVHASQNQNAYNPNSVYVANGQYPSPGGGGGGGWQQGAQYPPPQYPPQTFQGQNGGYGYGYDPNQGFAPPAGPPPNHTGYDAGGTPGAPGSPPQYYPPPPGVPGFAANGKTGA